MKWPSSTCALADATGSSRRGRRREQRDGDLRPSGTRPLLRRRSAPSVARTTRSSSSGPSRRTRGRRAGAARVGRDVARPVARAPSDTVPVRRRRWRGDRVRSPPARSRARTKKTAEDPGNGRARLGTVAEGTGGLYFRRMPTFSNSRLNATTSPDSTGCAMSTRSSAGRESIEAFLGKRVHEALEFLYMHVRAAQADAHRGARQFREGGASAGVERRDPCRPQRRDGRRLRGNREARA